MKGHLALETVVVWVILLVVIGVVTGIIFYYSSEIKGALKGLEKEEDSKTEMLEAESFSASQIQTYIELCWEKAKKEDFEEIVCYVLKGNISSIDPLKLEGDYGKYRVISNFDNTKSLLVIRFEGLGENRIILEN